MDSSGEAGNKERAAILADPAWLPHRVLDEGRTLQLVHLPRDEQRGLSFLDHRFVAEEIPRFELAVAELAGKDKPPTAAGCHFIFHSAFCCSTLMSRALGEAGAATSLHEPQALTDLACLLPKSHWPDDQQQALRVVLDLLERPHQVGGTTVIKPSDFANPLIDAILAFRPGSRILLMYAALPAFLLTIARRGRKYRSWARSLATIYRRHPQFETKRTNDLLLLTDLEVAAFVWLNHQARFVRLAATLPEGRVATLRADSFLAEPARTVHAASAHFGLGLTEEQAAAIAAGSVFGEHSKRPGRSFDPAALKREEALAGFAYGAEIGEAVEWAEAVAAQAGVPLSLEAPLLGRS
ncbi:MAG TPA: hypothetical protein VGB57_12245 [Allosphingosinicella sp.]|jgi:hypothetical protein